MKRKIAFSVWFVIVLVSCTVAETSVPTQAIDLENMDPTEAVAFLGEDIDIGDGGLLSGLPCSSPCTFGIRIGETQLEQVIPILEKNGISRCWTEPSVSWFLVSCDGSRLMCRQIRIQTWLMQFGSTQVFRSPWEILLKNTENRIM